MAEHPQLYLFDCLRFLLKSLWRFIMSAIQFAFQVVGTGETQLPVTILDPQPVGLSLATSPQTLNYRVENPLDREVTIENIAAVTSGPSADKVSVGVQDTVLVIPAQSFVTSLLTIGANEELTELDVIDVSVTGAEVPVAP